jgi:hypothetical protein
LVFWELVRVGFLGGDGAGFLGVGAGWLFGRSAASLPGGEMAGGKRVGCAQFRTFDVPVNLTFP